MTQNAILVLIRWPIALIGIKFISPVLKYREAPARREKSSTMLPWRFAVQRSAAIVGLASSTQRNLISSPQSICLLGRASDSVSKTPQLTRGAQHLSIVRAVARARPRRAARWRGAMPSRGVSLCSARLVSCAAVAGHSPPAGPRPRPAPGPNIHRRRAPTHGRASPIRRR
jgi:hypothetical protein